MERNKKNPTIEDLLASLQNPFEPKKGELANTKKTWERIGNNDKFDELKLEGSALTAFLREWIDSNPYNNI